MSSDRLPRNDPRTVARDIPGLFDVLFPQLAPGVVAHFNRGAEPVADCETVPLELVNASSLQHAMLFELGVAAGEQLLEGVSSVDWDTCLTVAVKRQKRHFDAKLPTTITQIDKDVAIWTAKNLTTMLRAIQGTSAHPLRTAPMIPGYRWIANGVGDFSLGSSLIEAKCSVRRFSASDYRQVVMYWLLSYAASIENDSPEWKEAVLLNPRLNLVVRLSFDEVLRVIGAGRSKLEAVELFSALVTDRKPKGS